MSSILDALNKLERDKVRAEKKATLEKDVDIESAARELVGHSLLRDRFTLNLSPALLMAVVLVFSLILVVSGVGVSWAYFRSEQPSTVAKQNVVPPDEDSAPVETAAVTPGLVESSDPPAQPKSEEEISVALVSAPEPVSPVVESAADPPEENPMAAQDTTDPPTVSTEEQTDSELIEASSDESVDVSPEPVKEPLVVARETVQESVREEPRRPVASRPPAEEAASGDAVESASVPWTPPTPPTADPPKMESPVDTPALASIGPTPLNYLPAFSTAVRTEYDIPRLRVNHIHLGDAAKPRPYAWINNIPVYVGEQIQGSKARLKNVAEDGVAIEIIGTKGQYFLKFF